MSSAAAAASASAEGLLSLPGRLQAAEGWASLRAALDAGQSGTIDGAWGSAAALAAAALAADAPATLLVVVPGAADSPSFVEDLASFSGIRPTVFEAWETWPPATHKGKLDPATTSRLRLLQLLRVDPPKIIVATMAALIQPVPARDDLAGRGRQLAVGEVIDPSDLAVWLVDNGYKRVEAVEYPGEFSRRGGICDIFPPDAADPVRLEFFGDEVESIRTFATGSQRSLETRASFTLLEVENKAHPSQRVGLQGFFTDYLPPRSRIALYEPGDLKEHAKLFFERIADASGLFTIEHTFAHLMQFPTVAISMMPR
ncbi:MAG TPA: transcription-repair coupling factor, partial [Urbifossiella sp.]